MHIVISLFVYLFEGFVGDKDVGTCTLFLFFSKRLITEKTFLDLPVPKSKSGISRSNDAYEIGYSEMFDNGGGGGGGFADDTTE
jgi:hypothetical protein